jgi:hypothetical protein
LKLAGKVTVVIGSLVFLLSVSLLHYVDSATLWDLTTRLPVILIVLAVGALIVAGVSFFQQSIILPIISTCVGFYLFGQFFDIATSSYRGYGVGFWLGSAGALAMAVGGLLSLLGCAQTQATTPYARDDLAVSPVTPAPGWYPDPSAQFRMRYWSGVGWTDQVQA